MARNYELTFIARPEMDPASLTALIERVKGLITAESGTIVKVDQWGVRRLSYPINKIRDGQYVYLFVQLEAQSVQKVESRLKLMEPIIRYLLVKSEDTTVTKPEAAAAETAAPAIDTPEAAQDPALEVAPVAAMADEAVPMTAVAEDAAIRDEGNQTQAQQQPTSETASEQTAEPTAQSTSEPAPVVE